MTLNLSEDRKDGLMLCECGLLKAWHGEMVPAYFGAERFGEMVTFEMRSRGCEGFRPRADQAFHWSQVPGGKW